ncbi:MAG: anthranilate synthase component I family protein [Saprospiraceae bacterium]
MFTNTLRLPYTDALKLYDGLRGNGASCLFESSAASDKSSRMSLIGIDPLIEFIGQTDQLSVRLIEQRGEPFFNFIQTEFREFIQTEDSTQLQLYIPKLPFHGPESQRLERQNIAQPLRALLNAFKTDEKNFMGLYGAFAYQFVYLFEDIPAAKPGNSPDFHLFLYDTVLLFNHLTHDLSLYCTRSTQADAEHAVKSISQRIKEAQPAAEMQPEIGPFFSSPNDDQFQKNIAKGIELCYAGELLEIVLSRQLSAEVSGDMLPLYSRYKQVNPSPYMFYFDFGNELLLGASPELMLRYEDGRAVLRPISGSVRRSENPIEDHRLMMELLNSPKENSELDMLIDLGRNDLARICKPGIQIDAYRIIEKYSHVTHTVAQVSGELDGSYTGFDALIASLNAGTLTGAPKLAAMNYIEQIEEHHRGYYGGSIGWLHFNGELNTAITIRTAHVKDGLLNFCTGATILYESTPENELKETRIKAAAFEQAMTKFQS